MLLDDATPSHDVSPSTRMTDPTSITSSIEASLPSDFREAYVVTVRDSAGELLVTNWHHFTDLTIYDISWELEENGKIVQQGSLDPLSTEPSKSERISIPFEKLEPIIERIEKLSTIQRVAIYAATFIILVGSVVWFLYMPKYEKKDQLTKETETLEGKLRVAKRNAAQLPKLRKQMKAAELEYRLVMKALPER